MAASTPSGSPTPGARLRELLAADGPLITPSCWDCVSARLLQESGFDSVAVSGAAVSASRLGKPDFGFLGLGEMADTVRNVCSTVSVPVLSDADTGFGGVLNAIDTTERLCAAGAAGMHIEDQVFPKRCGHLAGKAVVPAGEYLAKIRAVVAERPDPDFMIVARTDVLAVEGVDAAIDRSRRAVEAGADAVFVEAPESVSELERIGREVEGPKLYNLATGGRGPRLSFAELSDLGFDWILLPALAMVALIEGVRTMSAAVVEAGTDDVLLEAQFGPKAFAEMFGGGDLRALEDRYTADAQAPTPAA